MGTFCCLEHVWILNHRSRFKILWSEVCWWLSWCQPYNMLIDTSGVKIYPVEERGLLMLIEASIERWRTTKVTAKKFIPDHGRSIGRSWKTFVGLKIAMKYCLVCQEWQIRPCTSSVNHLFNLAQLCEGSRECDILGYSYMFFVNLEAYDHVSEMGQLCHYTGSLHEHI